MEYGLRPWISKYRKSHDEAWNYLLHVLRPDVAFVQEALVGKFMEAEQDHSVTVCDLGPGVTAGTAVLVCRLDVRKIPNVSVSSHTYTATTEIYTPAGPLTVLSVHVYPGKEQYADLERLVSLVDSSSEHKSILVGGDFNAARHYDDVYKGKKCKAFFAAMERAPR